MCVLKREYHVNLIYGLDKHNWYCKTGHVTQSWKCIKFYFSVEGRRFKTTKKEMFLSMTATASVTDTDTPIGNRPL